MWTGSREGVSMRLSQLPGWARAKSRIGNFTPVGIIPGAVEALPGKTDGGQAGGPRYALYFSPVVNALDAICLPVGIGVAYRR